MKLKSILLSLIAVGGLTVFSAASANAQYGAAIVTENNNCLIPDGQRTVRVFKCRDSGTRYNIYNGRIKTGDGLCFDHKVPPGTHPSRVEDPSVVLYKCTGDKSQTWYFIQDGPGKKLVQNARNPDLCMNIEGGNDSPGARLIVWPCGYKNPAPNERFYVGERVTIDMVRAAGFSPQSVSQLQNGGALVFSGARRLIGQDGATMIAAGAGNMVAAGAGNLIGQDGATVKAGGLGRLIGNDGAGVVGQNGMGMIAAGAGNMIAAGAGNLVGNDGSSLRKFLSQ